MLLNKNNADKRIYELKTINDKELVEIWMYLKGFFVTLWEDPKAVASLLINANPKEIEKTLLPLFANNFYENILSQKFVQNNLLYIITLLLKHEIKTSCNLSCPKTFLNIKSPCGYLLYELRNKRDFQIFLKSAIEEAVEIIEYYPYDICFNIDKIDFDIKQQYNFKDKPLEINTKKNPSDDSDFTQIIKTKKREFDPNNMDKIEELKKKYFSINMDLDNELNPISSNYYLNTFNIPLKEKQIDNSSIKDFLEKIRKTENKDIFEYYLNDFYIVTKFIDTFLNNLINKINIIPYPIRVISKIISILIQQKYKNISEIKRNTFICRFFFSALFWPISENSNKSFSVADYLISEQSMYNLLNIEKIFYEFIMGELYVNKKNEDYSPFNMFFIENMGLLIKFIDDLINVNLPEFIKNTLEDDNYIFDYQKENENNGIINRSICFKIEDINDIIINAVKRDDNVFLKNEHLKKSYEQLATNSNFDLLNNIDSNGKKNNKLCFYLISDCLFTKKYERKLKNKKKKKFFVLDIKNKPTKNKEKTQNIINEAKNLLSGLLFHLITLTQENISKDCQNNFEKLLKELLFLSKSSHYSFDSDITTSWYVEPLIDILPKLPNNLTKNNCQKLINELVNDIKSSIKELFEYNSTLNIIIDEKLNYTQTTISFLEDSIKISTGINSYMKVLDIAKKDIINVGFYIMNNNNESKFFLYQKNSSSISKYFDFNKYYLDYKPKIFQTIFEFIENFPDFNRTFDLTDKKDLLDLQSEMDIPNQLQKYFILINEYLDNNYKFLDNKLIDKEKIFNDIISKLNKNSLRKKTIEEKIIAKQESEDIHNFFKNFFGEINENISKNYKESINELIDLKEKMYDFIMESLYEKLYPKVTTEAENRIFEKMCLHSWVEPKHLDKKYENKTFYQSFLPDAKKYFHLFIKEKSPRKKIEVMNQLYNLIYKAIEFNEGKGQFGADDVIPFLTFCFIKARPYRMESSIKYTLLYNPYSKSSKETQGLTQLIMVNEFVNNLSFACFEGNMTKEEYEEKMN